jgi:murein L,D-transpeptidase YcbB/YkuD
MVHPPSGDGTDLAACENLEPTEGRIRRVLSVALALLAIARPLNAQERFQSSIRGSIVKAGLPGTHAEDFSLLVDDISRFYASRLDTPAWLEHARLSGPGKAAVGELLAAGSQGLDPALYDAHALDSLARGLARGTAGEPDLARLDLWITVSLTRYLSDLHFGRVHPAPFARGDRIDWAAALGGAIAGDSVPRLVAASAPQLTQYRNLLRLLEHYRGLEAADQVHQIELALERLRWLPPLGKSPLIAVNIPAFQLFAFDSAGGTGAPALAMKVVVGKAVSTRTPMLFEPMRYVEFLPYWNVPRSILLSEIIPTLRRNPSYLRAHDMELVVPGGGAAGDRVTADEIRRLMADSLRVRQRPGPANALGLVKFVFPNAAAVYLHGTPQSELFAKSRRDFSHGCIRVEDPAALAEWVLRDKPGWTADSVTGAMEGSTTRRVLLRKPLPVAVFYTTVVAMPDGTARFYPDVYGLDRELSEQLRSGEQVP